MKLDELFDTALLERCLKDGYVRAQTHNTEPLTILNYTEKATFAREWNPVTLACRGLIYNHDTMDLVAMPFAKFFNHDEPSAPKINLDAFVIATDKKDGSLGILYQEPSTGQYAIATRGSFHSAQAEHATRVLRKKYADWHPENQPLLRVVTLLFEIIYPANRIVVDYGKTDDLVLLGAVVYGNAIVSDGAWAMSGWRGPVVEDIYRGTYSGVFSLSNRENAEGIVVWDIFNNQRVKIKQEDYIRLHRIITGLNARSVHSMLTDGKTVDEINENLPEEFHLWVLETANDLIDQAIVLQVEVEKNFASIINMMGLNLNQVPTARERRAEFANLAKAHTNTGWLFLMLDQNFDKLDEAVWKAVRPAADWTPHVEK